ncbi:hypothetical protein TNCV_4999901 [Trichonephila clavipes]|nr:hypothetical protein TNCV_4999901 [Trichonephila clavipes]
MLKLLRIDIFKPQEMKLPVRLINTTNERRLVQGHGGTRNENPISGISGAVVSHVGSRIIDKVETAVAEPQDVRQVFQMGFNIFRTVIAKVVYIDPKRSVMTYKGST